MVLDPLQSLFEELQKLEDWSKQALHELIETIAAKHELKMGKIAQPLRVAVCGTGVSPSIDVTLELLGRERVP